ncbi:amidohydrolase [Peribacillus butanolivorans]|uniref:Peptidase M20 domain-containing protein 2 n=1 Tax=Peribacillus butanolivorans TaxID=421767 RepID=A0AAX0RXY9_9BACI|nr:M20 family metallopeptidase [Peribacillus butanolivorans]MCO0600498.1 M20 family metallopeptidase [Peribacillus butanolivorans]PEJ27226.1 amidohydrolase [Peribacillus butanolivorans]
MHNEKLKIFSTIEDLREELISINNFIHDNPELGNKEFKAVELITETLSKHEFEIEKGVVGLPTAFVATYKNRIGGPVIGLLCEYDALEKLGHACGHNLQAPSVLGAAIALKKHLGDNPATIKVIGTPAEETTSGKIPMTKAGLFDDLDVALMMHGGDRTTVDGKSLAVNNLEFIFKGKSAHAAVAPEKGISALDGVLMTFNGIEYLREHVRDDVRMHGIISEGGIAPNIVPERAVAKFSIRAADRPYLDEVVERVCNVAKGSALATGTEIIINKGKSLESKLNVQQLNDILLDNANQAGAKQITPPRSKTGSTDFSIVTQRVPGACIRVAFVPLGVSNHTKEWEVAGTSKNGHEAIIEGAKALSGTSYDLIKNPEKLKKVREEFEMVKESQHSMKQNVSI